VPIIERAPADSPLSQGDILQSIPLFATIECWMPAGGKSALQPEKLCLVLSRPCVTAHKRTIVVGAIQQYKGRVPKDAETFDDYRAFLEDCRDAPEQPDVFYIGQIPEKQGRFCARLDSLHTIEIPTAADALRDFVRTSRTARLQIDFIRDLHSRVFRAFASLGFDDYSWFCTDDLQLLVDKGQAEIFTAKAELQERKTAKGKKEFAGNQYPEAEMKEAERKVVELEERVKPYLAELGKRTLTLPAAGADLPVDDEFAGK